jgi:hypothetical protein
MHIVDVLGRQAGGQTVLEKPARREAAMARTSITTCTPAVFSRPIRLSSVAAS